ncbi:FGFR1 oncogene partner 2 homolog isoform X2 [Ischnura elegans]|nr:FGFR1 oncogene partner 2 homolog isoform X2 [Ischnura elegans]XP_046394504.1 FGFR1 oncogene partner 2 homolog isoform X2 [Ischnura elegans]XP_046394505.1 FGFR1 oncogene partner 2 homolog isoform X2 [Ischnura elegans]XP_046394506.1 FGFR1 oncogene partner 2 homolog isoform X2 [Ischnura elegans]XP_046394507.1 FGFR1 oncogene partner 2 homolog isoform X2 [Ischnura elegans]
MSLTVQQILQDAKRLTSRLKVHESTADALLTQAHYVYKQIDAMKQYEDEVKSMSEAGRQRPAAELVSGIQQENWRLLELKAENRQLREALEDSQGALEMIMTKYREHINALITKGRPDPIEAFNRDDSAKIIQEKTEKICEMAAVMSRAIQMDDSLHNEEMISKLTVENKALRELLEISCQNGSLRKSLLSPETDDKGVQTEASELQSGPS